MKQNKALGVSTHLYEQFYRNELSEKERFEFIQQAKESQYYERSRIKIYYDETRNDNSRVN